MSGDSLQVEDGPVPFDPNVPNVARIYDFLLQGKDNFAADREAAGNSLTAVPAAAPAARDNRRFLGRAVWFLAREAGIRQFLDIGTGLPTPGNVHQIAHAAESLSRVVYVDNDPVVVAHANALLADSLKVAAVHADVRDPGFLLSLPTVRALSTSSSPWRCSWSRCCISFRGRRPVVDREQLYVRDGTGSYLVVSHVTGDGSPAEAIQEAAEIYEHASAPGTARPRAQVARFFHGLDMVAPGLADLNTGAIRSQAGTRARCFLRGRWPQTRAGGGTREAAGYQRRHSALGYGRAAHGADHRRGRRPARLVPYRYAP